MAGAEALIAKISQETEDKENEILKKGEEEAAKIVAKAKVEATDLANSIELKSKKRAEENKRRAFTMAELESRKEILNEKQIQIDNAFLGAIQKISEIDVAEYQKIIMDMIMEAVESGEETVMVAPVDKERLDEEFIKKANEELKKVGKNGNLKRAVDTENFGGGVILKSAQYAMNSSFKSIIKMQRDELEPEVAEILFQ